MGPKSPTVIESIRISLHEMMEEDPRVVVLGEDILDPYGGAFKATLGLSTRFPERVFTTPISEASIVGVSVGLALRGMRPIAEIMFGDFLTLAADQIVNHAAKYGAMYNGTASVPMIVRTPMGGGRGYGPTHSQSLEKLFFGVANLTILAPSHFHAAGEMLKSAAQGDGPVLFIENKLLYPLLVPSEPDAHGLTCRLLDNHDGSPIVILDNFPQMKKPDLALIAYGGLSRLLEPALRELAQEEVWVRACLPGRLSPLDAATLLETIDGCDRVIVVEEGSPEFGWGAEVAAQIYEAKLSHLAAPVKRLGAKPGVIPASKTLEEMTLLSKQEIISSVFEVLQW